MSCRPCWPCLGGLGCMFRVLWLWGAASSKEAAEPELLPQQLEQTLCLKVMDTEASRKKLC